MLEKTRAIVLHQIKYTDSGIVAQVYSKKFGRQSFLIRGMRNRKTGKHNILFQPLFILDLELNYKQSHEMQNLKEFSVFFTPYDIYSNIKKSAVAIFLGEVLTSVLFVVKLGPDCYKDATRFPSGPSCKEGDFVIVRPNSGTRLKIHGREFRIINDDSVEAVVEDPRGITRAS